MTRKRDSFLPLRPARVGFLLALLFLPGVCAKGEVIYRETFGRPGPGTTANIGTTNFNWIRFNANGSLTALNSGVNGGAAGGTQTGRPTDVANVHAGPNSDGTFGAYALGWQFLDGTARLSYTPEYSFNPADYVPGSVVISWYQGNAALGQGFQVVVRVGGTWYASTRVFDNTTTFTADTFGTSAELMTYTFNPAAANWQILNFTGNYDPVTQTTTAGGTISLGAVATADLSGPITSFGLYRNATGSNGRVDSYTIEASSGTVVFTGTNIWTAAISSDWDFGTANWSNPAATPINYVDGSWTVFDDSASSGNVNLTTLFSPGATVVSNNTRAYTFNGSGALRGAGRLLKQGAATLVIDNSGSNGFTGPLTIEAGTLQIGNGDANGNLPPGSVVNNGALLFQRTDSFNVPSSIGGSGTLTKEGAGVMTLSGGNSFTGIVSISAGTLKAGAASVLGTAAGETIISPVATLDVNHFNMGLERIIVSGSGVGGAGAIIDSSGNPAFVSANVAYVTLTGDTVFGGTGRWDLRSNPTSTTNSALSTGGNPYNLTKVGTNQVSIVGTYVDPALGDIDVQNGMLSFETVTTSMGNPANLLLVHPGATLAFFNSTSQWNKSFLLVGDGVTATITNSSGTNTIASAVAINDSCVFGVASGQLICNGPVGGGGGILKHGAGSLILSAANDYTGKTIVSNGTLFVNGSLVGGGEVLVYGGTLAGVGQIGSSVTIAPNGTISPGSLGNGVAALEIGGSLVLQGTNAMDVNKSSSGIISDSLVFGTDITFGGTLKLNLSGDPLAPGDIITLYTFFALSGSFATISPAAPGIGLVWDTSQLTVDGTLRVASGGPPLLWSGTPNGDWDIGITPNWLANASATVYSDGSIVRLDDSAAGTSSVNLTTTLSPSSLTVSNSSRDYSFSGVGRLSGGTALIKEGSGKLTIANSAVNDYSGGTILSAGNLQFGTGTTAGNLPAGNITDNGSLILNHSDSFTISNVISGTGSLTQNGNNTITLGAANTFANGLTANAGTVRLTNVTSAGSGLITVNNGGTVVLGAAHANSIALAGGILGSTVNFTTAAAAEFRTAAGTTSLIQTADPQNPSTTVNIMVIGTLRGSGNIVVVNATNVTSVDGGQGFRLQGTTVSDYSGTITFSNNVKGELQTTAAGSYTPGGTGKFVMICGAATRDNTQNCPVSGGYSEFNLRNNSTGSDVMGNDLALVGSGFATLNPLGTAPAGSMITMGNLRIGGGQELGVYLSAAPAHVVTFASVTLTGGIATFSPKTPGFGATTSVGSDLTLGDISELAPGSGIIMSGLRTLTLTGNNTYSGNTIVSNGTLALTGNATIANSAIISVNTNATLNVAGRSDGTLTLASGQTLQGNGNIVGALNAGANSTVAPGASIGRLSVSGAVTLAGVAAMEVNRSAGTNDVLQSSTVIHYGGTLRLTNIAGALAAGDTFKLFEAPGYTDGFAAITPAPGAGLAWDQSLLGSSGTIRVVSAPVPGIASATLSGTDVIISGTNGTPGQTYYVLSSTNVALPRANWVPIWTNTFGPGGQFSFTNAVIPGIQQRFYQIQTQ